MDINKPARLILFIILFLTTVLQIVLICLRAAAQITCDWALVFLPLYILGGSLTFLILLSVVLALFESVLQGPEFTEGDQLENPEGDDREKKEDE